MVRKFEVTDYTTGTESAKFKDADGVVQDTSTQYVPDAGSWKNWQTMAPSTTKWRSDPDIQAYVARR